MKAEIKNIISPDILNFETFQPADPESFCFLLEITVGLKGQNSGDNFSLQVLTPNWLLQNHQNNDVVFGRHVLIVFEFNLDAIFREIKNKIESLEGSSWQEIADKISRIAQWEFEDYRVKV